MDVEEEIIATLVCSLLQKRKKKRTKKFWIHPLLRERLTKGIYHTYFPDVLQYEYKFFNYMRMSKKTFYEILNILKPHFTGYSCFRECISAEEKLVITLRYLASGCSFAEISHNFQVGHTTARETVYDVCIKIWQLMKHIAFPELNESKWIEVAEGFKKNTEFPNCIGAIDGKHIELIKPAHSGSLYFNYKNYFSLVLLGICDADYRFIYVDIGAYGKCSDSSIFKESKFYKRLMDGHLNLPREKPIEENGPAMPFVLVGDEAFPLTENIMGPYPGRNLTNKKKGFNYRLSRARRYVECSFGILSNKWRIFHRPINVGTEFAIAIIQACCILHNIVRSNDGYRFEDTLYLRWINQSEIPSAQNVRANRTSVQYRDQFADYFINAGKLSWQDRLAFTS